MQDGFRTEAADHSTFDASLTSHRFQPSLVKIQLQDDIPNPSLVIPPSIKRSCIRAAAGNTVITSSIESR